MMIAAEKVLVKAERKVAVPQSAKSPGWILNPKMSKISPKSHPKMDPIIKAGVMIPLGIASVVSMNRMSILTTVITDKWVMIF